MLITLMKIFGFLFPFIKELLLGKEKPTNKNELPPLLIKSMFFKKTIIAIGCASVLLNIYLLKQIYVITSKNIELTKQINPKETKDLIIRPKELILPPPIVPTQPIPVDIKPPIVKPTKRKKTESIPTQNSDDIDELNRLNKYPW